MSKIIEVIVSPSGETKVETKGFVGAECQEASRFLDGALGKRLGEKLTTEFHHTASGQQLETRQK